jgi:hypothetical protein
MQASHVNPLGTNQLSPLEVSSVVADDAAILGRPDEADVKGRLIFFQTALFSPPTFYPSVQLAPVTNNVNETANCGR